MKEIILDVRGIEESALYSDDGTAYAERYRGRILRFEENAFIYVTAAGLPYSVPGGLVAVIARDRLRRAESGDPADFLPLHDRFNLQEIATLNPAE